MRERLVVTQQDPPDWFTELASRGDAEDRERQSREATPEEVASSRRRRRGRAIGGLIAVVVVVALVATYVGLTLNAPVGAAAVSTQPPNVLQPVAAHIAMPTGGEAAVSVSGADDYLGSGAEGVFASSGGDTEVPMASISKLITALVVLNAKPLGASGQGATITWSADDAKLYDKYYLLNATIAAMKAGSTMSEHDAIETMLVVSACNYAEAVADWAFGSNANFLYAERKWLVANGMDHTVMVEPTGIDPANKSTPSDLITLGKIAMANPTIASIVAKTSLDVPSLEGMPNTNDLLGVDGVDGIKTGTLEGSDLLFSSVISPGTPSSLTITGVILGGADRASVDSDVTAIIDSISAGFHHDTLGSQGEVVGTYSTAWGSKASMVLAKSASTLSWSNTPITSSITTTTLKTGARGETVGRVTWTAGKSTVTVPVVLASKVPGPSVWWRLTHPQQLLGR